MYEGIINASVWGLCLLGVALGVAQASGGAEAIAIEAAAGTIPVGDFTMPGALVWFGYLISKWKPGIRVELVDKRDNSDDD